MILFLHIRSTWGSLSPKRPPRWLCSAAKPSKNPASAVSQCGFSAAATHNLLGHFHIFTTNPLYTTPETSGFALAPESFWGSLQGRLSQGNKTWSSSFGWYPPSPHHSLLVGSFFFLLSWGVKTHESLDLDLRFAWRQIRLWRTQRIFPRRSFGLRTKCLGRISGMAKVETRAVHPGIWLSLLKTEKFSPFFFWSPGLGYWSHRFFPNLGDWSWSAGSNESNLWQVFAVIFIAEMVIKLIALGLIWGPGALTCPDDSDEIWLGVWQSLLDVRWSRTVSVS